VISLAEEIRVPKQVGTSPWGRITVSEHSRNHWLGWSVVSRFMRCSGISGGLRERSNGVRTLVWAQYECKDSLRVKVAKSYEDCPRSFVASNRQEQ
jgi:hypothetical protein